MRPPAIGSASGETPVWLNVDWHQAHPMHPWLTAEERSAWHDLHRAHCGCDEVPTTLAEMCRSASRSRMAR